MRALVVGMAMAMAGTTSLAGCGEAPSEKKAAADARAVGFTPPAVMSRVDFGTSMDRRFRELDRNADERLTSDELPRKNARLMQLDRDKNGSVSAIEFSEGTLKRFDAMDLNHDGTVTSEEHQAWRAANRARRADAAKADTPATDDDEDVLENKIATPN